METIVKKDFFDGYFLWFMDKRSYLISNIR